MAITKQNIFFCWSLLQLKINQGLVKSFAIAILSMLLLILVSCEEKEVPVVITSIPDNVSGTSATCGGSVVDEGSGIILERGICWSTDKDPDTDDETICYTPGIGDFIIDLENLNGGTTYYVKAYAINKDGTGYGITRSFTTRGQLPVAVTLLPTSVSTDNAFFNAKVNANYLSTDLFFEYGTTTGLGTSVPYPGNPVTGNSDITISVKVTSMLPATKYYYRIKAVNSLGIKYGDKVSFITKTSDLDGNIYSVIAIGEQYWMGENLKTTKYNDGKPIPLVTDDSKWASLSTAAYCWYNNDIKYKPIYGALYNWYAVKTNNLCPVGWHVPTDEEWTVLTEYLGGKDVAGGKIKEAGTSHWASPNTGASNESGFTAMPAGNRRYDGFFSGATGHATWRTSTEYDVNKVMYRYVFYHSASLYSASTNKNAGYSVRCIKD